MLVDLPGIDCVALPPVPYHHTTTMQAHSNSHNLPFDFVGRDAELSALSNAFAQGVRTVVIQGSAASGKTSLARVFAELHQDLFSEGIA